jgi:DNA-binding transcriptional LysR family regulator
LNSVPLFTDRHVSILSTQSAPSGELTIEEFGSRSHAIMRFGRNTMSIEEAALRRSGFEFEPRVITSSFSALLGVVATTSMVATVPERLTSILAGRLGLKAYNPPIEIPDLTEAMTWHTRHDFDPAHAWLRGLFIDCGREL